MKQLILLLPILLLFGCAKQYPEVVPTNGRTYVAPINIEDNEQPVYFFALFHVSKEGIKELVRAVQKLDQVQDTDVEGSFDAGGLVP